MHGPPHSREAEVKANVHTIQVAVERYYTDHGEYPAYLLGGSRDIWNLWHERMDGYMDCEMADGRIASNDLVNDPLIELGYVSEYPSNPFVDVRRGQEIITLTSYRAVGDILGDPRFGLDGRHMGMGLDDPNWFCGAIQPDPAGWSEIETRRTLDQGYWMRVLDEFQRPGTSGYYLFGGRGIPESGNIVFTFWPGSFFYRSLASQESEGCVLNGRYGPSTGVRESYHHYILGGFGSERTQGLDIIRLAPCSPDGGLVTWRFPKNHSEEVVYCAYNYPRSAGSSGGLPAVFGGGNAWTGPQFPPFDSASGDVLYGAPDGIPDGVIIVVNGY